jgi:hypothetical protein
MVMADFIVCHHTLCAAGWILAASGHGRSSLLVAWYVVHVNPEPWAVGPLDLGRRGGKVYATMGQNQQLAAYQEAVREETQVPES